MGLFSKLAEGIKEFKEAFSASYTNQYGKYTGIGIDIIHDDKFMKENNYLIGVCVLCDDGKHRVFVDDMFVTFPKEVQQFIVWHELGHINNKHYTGTTNLECECEADAWAASKIGKDKAIAGLEYLWATLGAIKPSACYWLPSRLKELGANVDNYGILLDNGTILREPDLRKIITNK